MSVTRYVFRTTGGMPVVIPPAEIDTTTAGENTASALAISADLRR